MTLSFAGRDEDSRCFVFPRGGSHGQPAGGGGAGEHGERCFLPWPQCWKLLWLVRSESYCFSLRVWTNLFPCSHFRVLTCSFYVADGLRGERDSPVRRYQRGGGEWTRVYIWTGVVGSQVGLVIVKNWMPALVHTFSFLFVSFSLGICLLTDSSSFFWILQYLCTFSSHFPVSLRLLASSSPFMFSFISVSLEAFLLFPSSSISTCTITSSSFSSHPYLHPVCLPHLPHLPLYYLLFIFASLKHPFLLH